MLAYLGPPLISVMLYKGNDKVDDVGCMISFYFCLDAITEYLAHLVYRKKEYPRKVNL